MMLGRRIAGAACAVLGMGAWVAAAPAAAQAAGCQTSSATFASTGAEQCYVVPVNAHSLDVTAVGAPGGAGSAFNTTFSGAAGGFGAVVTGHIAVTPGETLYVEVGGDGRSYAGMLTVGAVSAPGGFNGGGASGYGVDAGGGGGGASDVRTCSITAQSCPGGGSTLSSRLLVAAGGGGGGAGGVLGDGGTGGAGGLVGSAGAAGAGPAAAAGSGGGGGQQTAGGTGGTSAPCAGSEPPGAPGDLGVGGLGASFITPGGGGGGGLYGGGGGGSGGCPNADGEFDGESGGGGGSSFGPAGSTFALDTTGTPLVTIVPSAGAQVTATETFGTTPQDEISAPHTVTVTSTGAWPLSITGLSFAGADPDDFIVGSDGCLGALAPGTSCQLTVNFTPRAQGSRTATLDIASNAPNGPATVSLSGTGGGLPQGPAVPQGAQGVPGPAGTVVCRNAAIAHVLCSIEFAPGSVTAARRAAFTIRHANRVVARGTLALRPGRIANHDVRGLRRGRYTLTITAGGQTLLKRVFWA
jgi:hypothetical protein